MNWYDAVVYSCMKTTEFLCSQLSKSQIIIISSNNNSIYRTFNIAVTVNDNFVLGRRRSIGTRLHQRGQRIPSEVVGWDVSIRNALSLDSSPNFGLDCKCGFRRLHRASAIHVVPKLRRKEPLTPQPTITNFNFNDPNKLNQSYIYIFYSFDQNQIIN